MLMKLGSIDNNDNASFLSLSSSVNSNIVNHTTQKVQKDGDLF